MFTSGNFREKFNYVTEFIGRMLCGTFVSDIHCFHFSPPGGLLIALPREQAAAFCKDIEKQEGYQSWIIGIVEKGQRTARIIDKPRVIEVPAKEKDGELW